MLAVAALAWWQRQAVARLIVIAGVEAIAHVRVSVERSMVTASRAEFDTIAVTSRGGEPIATISRLELAYDMRDLFPGGKRRFGLKSVAVDSPHLTVIRHADGTYNVPLPQLTSAQPGHEAPLNLRVRVRDGSIAILDESPAALSNQRRLYVKDLVADATLSTASRSSYTVALRYGESAAELYPIVGRGTIDGSDGYADQRWTSPELPIAAAVNFLSNNPTMRLQSGRLENLDARVFALRGTTGAFQTHLAATAGLTAGVIAVAGLARPIENLRGGIDAYDDGLLTNGLDASLAGVPVRVTGGLYGLHSPHLQLAARGAGSLAQLRTAFVQAQRLPMQGHLDFALLVQGSASKPVTWIALRSPQVRYAATPIDRLRGLVAFDGREADVVDLDAAYGAVDVRGRGRIALAKSPHAVEMLLGVRSPAGAAPYASRLLPSIPLRADVLATADDPKHIALRGLLWGESGTERLDGIFDVDSRGSGSIGPVEIETNAGSLYARIALDRPHGSALGIVDARNFRIAPIGARLDATLFGAQAKTTIAAIGDVRLASALGVGRAHAMVALRNGALQGAIAGNLGDASSFGAIVGGTPSAPRIAGTVVVAGARYRDFDVNGSAGLVFDRSVLHVNDAQVAFGATLSRSRRKSRRSHAGQVDSTVRPQRTGPHLRCERARRAGAAANGEPGAGKHRRQPSGQGYRRRARGQREP